jgi:hypothetical protein
MSFLGQNLAEKTQFSNRQFYLPNLQVDYDLFPGKHLSTHHP